MSEDTLEKEHIFSEEKADDLGETKPADKDEEGKPELTIKFFCVEKWKKKQTLSIFDFSSLQGTVSSVLLIAVIALLVKCIKLKKRK